MNKDENPNLSESKSLEVSQVLSEKGLNDFLQILANLSCGSQEYFTVKQLSKFSQIGIKTLQAAVRNRELKSTCKHMQLIDDGVFVLYKHHPHQLSFLTLKIPSDSEIVYLAACRFADELVQETMKRLLPSEENPLYVWRWETGRDKRLHLHVYFKAAFRLSRKRLKEIWFAALERVLGEKADCDPFIGEHGRSHHAGSEWVDLRSLHEQENQNQYSWSYLASPVKHGKAVHHYRRLDMLDGQRVSPVRHGGMSPALEKLAAETHSEIRLFCDSRESVEYFMNEFKTSIPADTISRFRNSTPNEWKQYGYMKKNWRCRILREEFDNVTELLRSPDVENMSAHPALSPYILVVHLHPNRRVRMYSYPNTNVPLPKRRKHRQPTYE
ncbi:MAG: hypothetical protein K2Z81_01275 [Cyanobacteria bacterium]|nr:hypothetical protein [Cyanobacteriota bacterium]